MIETIALLGAQAEYQSRVYAYADYERNSVGMHLFVDRSCSIHGHELLKMVGVATLRS